MKKSAYLFLLFYITLIGNAVANTPPIKPDWKTSQKIHTNLSGVHLSYIAPGNYSADFPLLHPENKNIYDESIYSEKNAFVLTRSYWDYKERFLFLQQLFGTLKMSIIVVKRSSDVKNDSVKTVKKGNVSWVFSTTPKQGTDSTFIEFSSPLTELHDLKVVFSIIESEVREKYNWYATALSDIEKIMNSFEIKQAQEN